MSKGMYIYVYNTFSKVACFVYGGKHRRKERDDMQVLLNAVQDSEHLYLAKVWPLISRESALQNLRIHEIFCKRDV